MALILLGLPVLPSALQMFRIIKESSFIIQAIVFTLLPPCIIFVVTILNTRYFLRENELYIRYGFFRLRVAYKNIISVKHERTFWGTLAGLSIDNIEIKYDNNKGYFKKIYISPKNQSEFIGQLNNRRGKS